MNPQEAMKVIKDNYPPENYTLLREALDLAIEELSKNMEIDELIASISLFGENAIVKAGYKVSGYDKA